MFHSLSGQSLRHIKSGLCVHPSAGSAGYGVALVIWKGCDVGERISLSFVEQGTYVNDIT